MVVYVNQRHFDLRVKSTPGRYYIGRSNELKVLTLWGCVTTTMRQFPGNIALEVFNVSFEYKGGWNFRLFFL